ncbi:MAG: molybdopterin-dependent oxidoreductase [Proteobacteria bacterium]|nr:molybdopterin-dependent oxidoreductase [Pseudomonadota bacterium]
MGHPTAPTGITRRTLLEWLGTGITLSLGPGLLRALEAAAAQPGGGDPQLRPGQGEAPLFASWPVRTVDSQDLAAILAGWRLQVGGLVERPFSLSFADLLASRTDRTADLHCVEGWSVLDIRWSGVPLAELLARARPLAIATHVNFHTLGAKYNESLPLAVAREPATLLAFAAAGETLPLAHGFPLRLVVPRLLGYKSAKFVHRVELADRPLQGFWVQNGYPYGGEVPSERLRAGRY